MRLDDIKVSSEVVSKVPVDKRLTNFEFEIRRKKKNKN